VILLIFQKVGKVLVDMQQFMILVRWGAIRVAIGLRNFGGIESGPVAVSFFILRSKC